MTEEREEQRRAVLEALELGEVRHGVVSAVKNFGVFVDIGGLDGMVSAANLSWAHVDHFSDVAHVGQSMTVVVLDIDRDRERVSLSLKDLEPDPLIAFARSRLGDEVSGIVAGVLPPGVVGSVWTPRSTGSCLPTTRAWHGWRWMAASAPRATS